MHSSCGYLSLPLPSASIVNLTARVRPNNFLLSSNLSRSGRSCVRKIKDGKLLISLAHTMHCPDSPESSAENDSRTMHSSDLVVFITSAENSIASEKQKESVDRKKALAKERVAFYYCILFRFYDCEQIHFVPKIWPNYQVQVALKSSPSQGLLTNDNESSLVTDMKPFPVSNSPYSSKLFKLVYFCLKKMISKNGGLVVEKCCGLLKCSTFMTRGTFSRTKPSRVGSYVS